MFAPCTPIFSGLGLVNNVLSLNRWMFDRNSVCSLMTTSKALLPHDPSYFRAEVAIRKKNSVRLRTLLEGGAAVEIGKEPFNASLWTSLTTVYGADECGIVLLDFVPWANDKYLLTQALYSLLDRGCYKTIQALMQRGAEPDSVTVNSASLRELHTMLENDTRPRGVLADLREDEMFAHNTLLINACKWSQKDKVALLLKYGANPNLKNKYGETAIDISFEKWGEQDPDDYECGYRNYDALDCLELLVKAGADLNVYDKRGLTPLMKLCELTWEMSSLIKLFLEKGANKNITCRVKGWKALDYVRDSSNFYTPSQSYIDLLSQ